MSSLYPDHTKKLDFLSHLEELRKRILWCLVVLAAGSVISFLYGNTILRFAKRPIHGLVDELIFISPTEAFVAYLKVSILSGLIICFPVILYNVWAFLAPAVPKKVKRRIVLWLFSAFVLFLAGIAFSYFIAIPAALNFLVGFGKKLAVAKITLGKYISFFGALIFVGGIVFEIPIVMGLLADAGVVKASVLKKKRHYAIVVILIFAAIITPTQDILNMLLFALPMIVLYEVGITIASLVERRK